MKEKTERRRKRRVHMDGPRQNQIKLVSFKSKLRAMFGRCTRMCSKTSRQNGTNNNNNIRSLIIIK